MTSGMTAFLAAVGGTSLLCYLLMNRAQNHKARRESAGDNSTIGSGDSSGGSLFSWFSSDSSCPDSSGSSDCSGGDSGGGGDGGGGGGD